MLVQDNATTQGISSWEAPATWNTGQVPTASDDVLIGYPVNTSQPIDVQSLALTGGNLQLYADATIAGQLTLATGPSGPSMLSVSNATLTATSLVTTSPQPNPALPGNHIYLGQSVVQADLDNDWVEATGTSRIAGAISNSFVIVDLRGTLELDGAITNSTLSFHEPRLNGNIYYESTLKIDDPTALSGTSFAYVGFGDVIDFAGVDATSGSYDGSTLTLHEANGGTLSFALGAVGDGIDLLQGHLELEPDGQGGTNVFWAGVPRQLADASNQLGYVNGARDTATQTLTGKADPGDTVTVYNTPRLPFTFALGTTTADSNGNWSFTLGHLDDGPYTLTATETNSVGHVSIASDPLTFTVDTTPPPVPTSLADTAIVGGIVDVARNTAGQMLTGLAPTDNTDVVIRAITIYDNGHAIGAATPNLNIPGDPWSFTLGVLAPGSHTLTATATDYAGNESAASSALTFTVGPPPPPTGLADAAIVSGYVNAAHDTTTQTLTGDAQAGATVAVFDGAHGLGQALVDGSGHWTLTLGRLADGAHSLTAETISAGETSAASTALAFTVDTHAPVPDVLYINRAGANWTIYGYTDANASVALSDNGVQVGVGHADSRGVWAITVPLSASALHSFTEHSTDAAGNIGASTGAAQFSLASAPLVGGSGDDVLIAWGSDTLTGGAGADRFVVDAVFTHRAITDFSHAQHDVIELDASAYHNYGWVMAHSTQVGTDTVINVNGDLLTLQNVTRTSLQAGDFIFA
jgi:hypothetical protein